MVWSVAESKNLDDPYSSSWPGNFFRNLHKLISRFDMTVLSKTHDPLYTFIWCPPNQNHLLAKVIQQCLPFFTLATTRPWALMWSLYYIFGVVVQWRWRGSLAVPNWPVIFNVTTSSLYGFIRNLFAYLNLVFSIIKYLQPLFLIS